MTSQNAPIEVPASILDPCDRGVRARRAMEYRIIHKTVGDLLMAGYTLWIDHGGDDKRIDILSNELEPMRELFACDDEYLYVEHNGEEFGWIRFVYGNDGWDVVSDYTTNLEGTMEAVNAYADSL